jgi:hypothetical protein
MKNFQEYYIEEERSNNNLCTDVIDVKSIENYCDSQQTITDDEN